MATKTHKTTAPTGLTIARKNLNLVCTWKVSDNKYENTKFQWRVKKVGKTASKWEWDFTDKTTYTLNLANFGSGLERIDIKVAALRDITTLPVGTVSAWSSDASKSYTISVPNAPSLSQKLSQDYDNVCTFTWSVTVKDDDARPFDHVEWQTLLAKESTVTDGSKLSWKAGVLGWEAGTGTKSSSKTKTEETTLLSSNSYTRWFRVRSVGIGGASAWKYVKHVFAMPWSPKINKATKEGDLNWVRVNWTADQSVAHPIDNTEVEWAIGTPNTGRTPPAGTSWNSARSIKDTSGTDEVSFLVDQQVDVDECMWVRISVQHDRNWRATGGKLVTSGKLSAPSDLSVEANPSTYRVEVTANNNSSVPDSRLAIVLRRKNKADVIVGISSVGPGEKTVTAQCPSWAGTTEIAFGVYAFQGSASGKTSGSVTTYAVTANMKSDELWDGGSVPLAPTGVTAAATSTEGEVLMSWNWTWTDANRTELSWSQNPNAWESTDEPETYMITNLHVPKWRISGLETGVIWYFRVRLAEESGDDITYGPYCDVVSVDLSSAPETPVLSLSAAAIAEGGTFTASWGYVSSDGTAQRNAELCEVTISGETITYGRVIAHAKTEQHIDMAALSTWQTGTEHSLCVRVMSESGRMSEWSDPVTIAIADPITCEITQTSLETIAGKNKIIYPFTDETKTYAGITFTDNEDGTITADGTATSSASFMICDESSWRELPAGTYTLTGCPTEGISGTAYISANFYDGDNVYSGSMQDTGAGDTHTFESSIRLNSYGIIISVMSGTTLDNVVFRPMLRQSFEDDEFEPYSPVNALTAMPFTATVAGAGIGGTTTLIIQRDGDYFMLRPDETELDGYDGETIVLVRQDGEAQITVGLDDLIGRLDDGALYRLIATTQDGYGQTATDEIAFEVHWDHQAGIPTATVIMDGAVAKITPIAPTVFETGDVCNIYRLSVDKPELIVENGVFGETYVDPYPALGENGGHRIVHITANGDYITADNRPAWIDLGADDGDLLDADYAIIDFGDAQIELPYDVALDNSWSKDFKQTTYLGGAIQGDWKKGVIRMGSVDSSILTEDTELVQALRRLAEYEGICHVRTQDGSSYAADVQVSDGASYDKAGKIMELSLSITKVDPEGFDGVTLEEWEQDED